MGHKVHPQIHRTGILFPWSSRWVAKRGYSEYLKIDIEIREYLDKKFKEAQLDSVFVERGPKNMTITIFAAKPGVIIGRGGQGLDDLRKDIERKFLKLAVKVKLNIQEVRQPSLSAHVVAKTVVKDIENRVAFRRIMKQTIERVMNAGAQGIKITLAGRLNGVEIARRETLSQGKIPLITLRSNVEYAGDTAHTMYGAIGIKVWIYKGESFEMIDKLADKKEDIKRKPKK
ncbi:MAG: 30S ribosomal protein S3 [uncultured bacterium]|nr:MAG: 30S ribosomal protein S3 [uncultured bacterium]MDD2656496.1 30S ribosomal protein S3 [Patescibacteria group bacterium]OGH84819.1 MAG: 30S ribosomal protein S3 [Candidatus Magasanikbacteria bacterium RIFOXYC12_FULL_32_21b]OGH91610.1 MAG: 30S ribosomal protein S3 [Candidatus Magasanikbacteria bacterium RIFOXYD12_FULL_33_17]HAO52488.1 30S ribosomal protein S3 [Candidatus Magasanikbacteria bacterium]